MNDNSRRTPQLGGLFHSDVACWPIASFRCDAEFGCCWGIADIDQSRFVRRRPSAVGTTANLGHRPESYEPAAASI
jgi:hypothetical protein